MWASILHSAWSLYVVVDHYCLHFTCKYIYTYISLCVCVCVCHIFIELYLNNIYRSILITQVRARATTLTINLHRPLRWLSFGLVGRQPLFTSACFLTKLSHSLSLSISLFLSISVTVSIILSLSVRISFSLLYFFRRNGPRMPNVRVSRPQALLRVRKVKWFYKHSEKFLSLSANGRIWNLQAWYSIQKLELVKIARARILRLVGD